MSISKQYCPCCGSVAKILLNIVDCLSPPCQNYSQDWASEYSCNNSQKNYSHHSTTHNFLGSKTIEGDLFDFYHTVTLKGQGICFARYGDRDVDCFYVDDLQTEIGNLASGPLRKISSRIQKALKEALRRSPRAKTP